MHEGLLPLTGVIAVHVLPVVAIATVGHEATNAQEDDAPALGAYRLGGRGLRRCDDDAVRRYCCLHGLFSCLWPRAAQSEPGGWLASAPLWRQTNARPDSVVKHTSRSETLATIRDVVLQLGDPSKRYYSIV